ncbi:Gfo/Idh/MocA family protein [Hamadaea tsunoensis]|uniref:Gfo/Idh/MocA family protein n=1 Tax=Hamadaea tsunoensis TaxID=53368 RepID=UPI00048006DF|nr:Gfo/Idh/MocA family oxidoreductase [Hamadaea tsunoensis]
MNTVIVGCGAIADRWARALQADGRANVVAVADPDQQRAEHLVRQRFPAAAAVADLRQALGVTSADVVVNLTPPDRHPQIISQALEAGLHVLTEKPLTLHLADALDLARLAQERNLVLAVMHNRALDPRFAAFAQPLRDRGPYTVSADVSVTLTTPGFRADTDRPVLTDLAVHAFDQVQSLITAAPLTVTATEIGLPFLADHCSLATVTVAFADGSVLAYRGSYTTVSTRAGALGRWHVTADAASGQWEVEPAAVGAVPAYQTCITTMIDAVGAVRAGRPPVRPTIALRSSAILDAALVSAARHGRTTTIHCIPQVAS